MLCILHGFWRPQFPLGDRGRVCKVTIDGTDVPLQEPYPYTDAYNRRFYSVKLKRAAYTYEVAVCIQTGDIVWINGPFKAGEWAEVKIFRRNLKNMLAPGEMVEADAGYHDDRIRNKYTFVNRADMKAKSAARA